MFSKPERDNANVKRRITPELIQPNPSTIKLSAMESTPSPALEMEQTQMECVICYESLNASKNICTTECGHKFCLTCMMKHSRRNNGCPLCRAVIIDSESESESDSESEYEEDDDETIEEIIDESYPEFEIEQFVDAFEAKGYGLKDALSLLMCKFSKTDEKFTKTYITKLESDVEDINEELQNECEERHEMSAEDVRL